MDLRKNALKKRAFFQSPIYINQNFQRLFTYKINKIGSFSMKIRDMIRQDNPLFYLLGAVFFFRAISVWKYLLFIDIFSIRIKYPWHFLIFFILPGNIDSLFSGFIPACCYNVIATRPCLKYQTSTRVRP